MTDASRHDLMVRRLLVDLNQPFSRHWNGGSAFRTAFANALSMSFPLGEQFFMESVQQGLKLLPNDPAHDDLRRNGKDFVGQEATHRHLHARFNQVLSDQGLVNHWQTRIRGRIEWARQRSAKASARSRALHELAVTAAFEHFTAVFGEQTLARRDQAGDWFEGAEPALKTLWCWHASEESEHKNLAFDLYQALGGHHAGRVRWFVYVGLTFAFDSLRQTVNNLWHDGTLFQWRTWRDGLRFFWGRHGLIWSCLPELLSYFRRDFHPSHSGQSELAQQWLKAHQHLWTAVNPRPVSSN